MSTYFVKGKGWRFDFILNGQRHSGAWFKTKKEAKRQEALKKEEVSRPKLSQEEIPTDTDFLELVNRRLDHIKAYNSANYYRDYCYLARRWVNLWGNLQCSEINNWDVEQFILKRRRVSAYTANMEIRALRALFNFGSKKKLTQNNPVEGISFLPVEKRIKYIPPLEDIDTVIEAADPDTQDYLWTIRETMARVSEINRLTWDEVDLRNKSIVLYTRKKRGGNLTPRRIPLTDKLFSILERRFTERDASKPWVFWHRYWSRKDQVWKEGPFRDRKRIMKSLCEKVGVKYFRFHALRHAGASLMDSCNIPLGSIQKILGHESRSTTEIYLHALGNSERSAMQIYELARQKSHTKSHTAIQGITQHSM